MGAAQRQAHPHSAAGLKVGVDLHRTSVPIDHLLHQRQPHAGAATAIALGAEKRLEYLVVV